MHIYQEIQSYLTHTTHVQNWPELSNVITRACERQDRNWLLPVLAGQAVGAAPASLVPAAAAIACLQMHLMVNDDMLDADPRGLHHRLGMPAAANLNSALVALGTDAVRWSDCAPEARLAALSCLANMCLTTSYGQHLDTLNPDTEERYWAAVRAKSAPFFAAAFYIGAAMAGADAETASQLEALGRLYGETIQIFDDVHDSMARPANPDWTQGRSPLPILFAQTVPHPRRDRFVQLRPLVADPAALESAQDILIQCGAVSYCVDQIVQRHHRARQVLDGLTLPDKAGLYALLEDLIRPVNDLLHMNVERWHTPDGPALPEVT